MNKLISVIVPVYKAEKYIDRCVGSLVNQTYKNIEILLIDDGSSDNCPALCDKWAKKDSRIKVIHKVNGGTAAARQSGVVAAEGEFIMFVDGDDWVRKDMCEYLLNLIDSGDYQAACCSYCLTTDDTEPPEANDETLTVLDFNGIIKGLYDYSLWSVCLKLFRRELFEKAEIPEINLTVSEDLLTNFYLFRQCSNIIVSNKEKYFYFRHEGSVMTTLTERRIADQLTAYKEISDNLSEGTLPHTYSMANRLLNDFVLLNSMIYHNKDRELSAPVLRDIKQCRKYIFSKENAYCMGMKYKIAFLMLMISPKLYSIMIKLSGKKY